MSWYRRKVINPRLPPPFQPLDTPAPPYNSPANHNYAVNGQILPNFPLNAGSNHSQVVRNTQVNSYFQYINSENQYIKNISSASNQPIPYKMFKSEQDRIKYLQGQRNASQRAEAVAFGVPSSPFPTPTAEQLCTNVNQIINAQQMLPI